MAGRRVRQEPGFLLGAPHGTNPYLRPLDLSYALIELVILLSPLTAAKQSRLTLLNAAVLAAVAASDGNVRLFREFLGWIGLGRGGRYRCLDQLVELKLVRRERVVGDQRRVLFFLTDEGRHALEGLSPQVAHIAKVTTPKRPSVEAVTPGLAPPHVTV